MAKMKLSQMSQTIAAKSLRNKKAVILKITAKKKKMTVLSKCIISQSFILASVEFYI